MNFASEAANTVGLAFSDNKRLRLRLRDVGRRKVRIAVSRRSLSQTCGISRRAERPPSSVRMWPHWRIGFPTLATALYGFGHILNNLAQQDRNVAEKAIAAADPIAIAMAFSNANPDTAYGLADLLRSIAYVKVDDFNAKVRTALDRDKLREFAKHEAFLEDAFIFSKFCLRWFAGTRI